MSRLTVVNAIEAYAKLTWTDHLRRLSASDKLPKFLTTLLDALEPTTPIHKTLTKLSAKLDALLAQPKPAGRQNLINMNQPGAEITQGKRVHDLDRQYSLLARQVSEALKKTWG